MKCPVHRDECPDAEACSTGYPCHIVRETLPKRGSEEPKTYSHDTYTHASDGRVCILDEHGRWWVPFDAGGEGMDCTRTHGPDPKKERLDLAYYTAQAVLNGAGNMLLNLHYREGGRLSPQSIITVNSAAQHVRDYRDEVLAGIEQPCVPTEDSGMCVTHDQPWPCISGNESE